jgi:DnaJ-class molecular chaperone
MAIIECPECKGLGHDPNPCEFCGGTGRMPRAEWMKCGKCHGTGHVRCLRCGGLGTINTERQLCPACARSGIGVGLGRIACVSCGGTGKMPDVVGMRTCPLCQGRGYTICLNCGGTGYVR